MVKKLRLNRNRKKTSTSTNSGSKPSVVKSSEFVKKQIKKEQVRQKKRQEERNKPFRYRLKPEGEGTIIVLDNEIVCAFNEHTINVNGSWTNEMCIKEHDVCPLCQIEEKPSVYTVFLTVLDLRPFTTKTGKRIKRSRKLLPVKPRQQKIFLTLQQQYRGLRGLKLNMVRGDERTASIGDPLPLKKLSETVLAKNYGNAPIKKNGKIIKQKDEDIKPFDYEKLFDFPSAKELRNQYGGGSVPGEDDNDDGDLPF